MATILAHITVHPGMADRFESVARGLYEATHRHETGVLRYEYWRGTEEFTYYTLLAFRDYEAFLIHQVSDYHEAASPDLRPVIAGITLEWLDPVNDASPLPLTVGGAVGSSERERYYADRYPARIAQWWQTLR